MFLNTEGPGRRWVPRVRQPRNTRHRRGLPQCTEVMSNRFQHPALVSHLSPNNSPTQLPAACSPPDSSSPELPGSGLPSQAFPSPLLAQWPILAPPPSDSPRTGICHWDHTGSIPVSPVCRSLHACVCMCLYMCAHSPQQNHREHTGMILQVSMGMGTVPQDALCPVAWPFFGTSLWTRGRVPPMRSHHGLARRDLSEWPQCPFKSTICVPSAHSCYEPTLACSSCIFCCQDHDCTNWHCWP